MFRNILQFELKYQSKQLAFALLSVLFLVIGLQIGNQGYGRGVSIYNSPQSISEITGIISLGSVFIIMFFTIHGQTPTFQGEMLVGLPGVVIH